MPTDRRRRDIAFHEVLETLTRAPPWRGVFGELPGIGLAVALGPPVPLPDLTGEGDTLSVSAAVVMAVQAWFAARGLDTDARDVANAIEAAAFVAGEVPERFLTKALREWSDEL